MNLNNLLHFTILTKGIYMDDGAIKAICPIFLSKLGTKKVTNYQNSIF